MALSAQEGHAMRCIHCGGNVTDGDRFCPSCGKPIEASESRPTASPGIEAQEEALADAAPAEALTGGHEKKRSKRFKLVAAGVAALVAVIMVGALAWAFAAGPLQPVEARGEGQLPNVARAMTMWQDADKVEATLGVSDDEAQSYAADTLLYYPADLQGYDGWDSLYIDTTEGPAGGKGALDEVWVGFGGVEPKSTLAIVQEDGKIRMYSGPANGGTYGTGPRVQNPYGFIGNLADAPSTIESWETPALDGPTIAGLENELLQTGNKASYVREFSSIDARALLENLGFPADGLAEDSSLYCRHSLDASIIEAVSELAGGDSSSGEPMTYGYRWRGKAEVGGRTVYLAVDASSNATVSLFSDMSENGFYIPAQYLLTLYNPGVVVRCTFDEANYRAWCEVEEGMEQSGQPFKADAELSSGQNGDEASAGATGEARDEEDMAKDETAPEEAIVGKWYLKWIDDQEYILQIEKAAQSDGVNAGQSKCTVLRKGDGASFYGIWGYNPEGFEFEGHTYSYLVQLYGEKEECRLYMNVSEDRQSLRFVREDNHAEASWLAYG